MFLVQGNVRGYRPSIFLALRNYAGGIQAIIATQCLQSIGCMFRGPNENVMRTERDWKKGTNRTRKKRKKQNRETEQRAKRTRSPAESKKEIVIRAI